jgi:hypothetical protein
LIWALARRITLDPIEVAIKTKISARTGKKAGGSGEWKIAQPKYPTPTAREAKTENRALPIADRYHGAMNA